MSLQNLSDLFLYELWTLCAAIKQVIAELLRMSRLTSNYRIRDELKEGADNAKEHWYLLRTIISSYQPILEVDSCAMNGVIHPVSSFLTPVSPQTPVHLMLRLFALR
jgi:ferritin-like metal-binding protein YciE